MTSYFLNLLPYIVFGLICIGVASMVFSKDRQYWEHAKELKFRTPLSPLELQRVYLPDVPIDVVTKLLEVVEAQFGESPQLVRPQDNHCLINDDLDPSTFVSATEKTFGFKFTEEEIESLDGSFGSIARHCAKHCEMV